MPEVKTQAPAEVREMPAAVAPSEISWPAGKWRPVAALRAEMDCAFETFWQSFDGSRQAPRQWPCLLDTAFGSAMPAVDVLENEKDFRIVAELPGLSAEYIDIGISDDLLTVKCEKADECEEKANNYRVSERRFESFKHCFPFPRGVDAEKVVARFDKDVRTITMPKTAEAASRQKKIGITSGS